MIPSSTPPMRGRRLLCATALLALCARLYAAPERRTDGVPAPRPDVQAITLTPARVLLQGRYDEARVLADGRDRTGRTFDVGPRAAWIVADPRIAAIDALGTLRPLADGRTTLTVAAGGRRAQIVVEVRGVRRAAPPRFVADVEPVLARSGCNMGACHGAAAGKGGFKLSLRGFDPDLDYEAITRMAGARRVSRSQPENSLLLRKPTLAVAHRGGLRLQAGSPEYRLLRDWIAAGLPGPVPGEPRVVRVQTLPAVRALPVGQTQRFRVLARYADGTVRDVTSQALFTASDETVASVSPEGEAKAAGPGEGAVLVRYQSVVATARVVSPFGPARNTAAAPAAGHEAPERSIDRLIDQKLDALGLPASPRSVDADFLRRAYLDVIGVLPTPAEVRAFLADRAPDKRERLIDALLERPEYVDFWTLKWGDILKNSRRLLSDKGMVAFQNWIRRSVAENKPWDRFARELLLAQGSPYTDGPANYYRTAGTPQELAETTSQVFLGVRIQCARCHNHPYEKWTQNQYYRMAAFFARVRARKGDGAEERLVVLAGAGEVQHPKTRKDVVPAALDAAPIPAAYTGDRREMLADWLTSPRNPFFGRIIANRLWRHFMGRGLVEPVDDIRVTNPPTNGPLLDWMAADLAAHGYDLKYLMRAILRTRTYQRAAEPARGNERDTRYYSRYPFKRLGAEQLIDALSAATGVPEKFAGYPAGLRAAQLPDTGVPSYFLDLFGRPARAISCECERQDEPNLGQVLHLLNDASLNARLADKSGRVATLLAAKTPDRRLVEELYLASVSRLPTAEEGKKAVQALARTKNRQQTAEDLLWALLNSKEFLFNH